MDGDEDHSRIVTGGNIYARSHMSIHAGCYWIPSGIKVLWSQFEYKIRKSGSLEAKIPRMWQGPMRSHRP